MRTICNNYNSDQSNQIATNFSSRFSQKKSLTSLLFPRYLYLEHHDASQPIFSLSFPSPSLSFPLSFFFTTMKRWKFTERWTESNNIRGSCHHRQLLFFNWRPRTRLRTPRERRRRVQPPLFPASSRARVPVKKLAWKFFQLKTVGAHRRDEVRATARSRERDATRRVATPRAALVAPLVGAEEGRGEGGGVSFNYCSIVTHGPFQ